MTDRATKLLLAMAAAGSTDLAAAATLVDQVEAAAAPSDVPDPSNLEAAKAERDEWRQVRDDPASPALQVKRARKAIRALNLQIGSGGKAGE